MHIGKAKFDFGTVPYIKQIRLEEICFSEEKEVTAGRHNTELTTSVRQIKSMTHF